MGLGLFLIGWALLHIPASVYSFADGKWWSGALFAVGGLFYFWAAYRVIEEA
jgi:hypothetical protein